MWHETGGNPFERTEIAMERWSGPVPTAEEDLAFLPVHRLAALIRARDISSSELTEVYLDRLKRLDPVLLCAVTILEAVRGKKRARPTWKSRPGNGADPSTASPTAQGPVRRRGNAHDVGAADFSHQFTRYNSEIVMRLRKAGAVLAAKLATGEFARGDRWYRGRTLNPWNLDEGSSGSSAGPGSATAAGCVAFAIGTETQGPLCRPRGAAD